MTHIDILQVYALELPIDETNLLTALNSLTLLDIDRDEVMEKAKRVTLSTLAKIDALVTYSLEFLVTKVNLGATANLAECCKTFLTAKMAESGLDLTNLLEELQITIAKLIKDTRDQEYLNYLNNWKELIIQHLRFVKNK